MKTFDLVGNVHLRLGRFFLDSAAGDFYLAIELVNFAKYLLLFARIKSFEICIFSLILHELFL